MKIATVEGVWEEGWGAKNKRIVNFGHLIGFLNDGFSADKSEKYWADLPYVEYFSDCRGMFEIHKQSY